VTLSLSLLSVPPLYISLSPALQSARSGGAPSWRGVMRRHHRQAGGPARRRAAPRQGRRDGHLHGEEVGGEG
jgi:hypothetical protein